MRENKFRGVSQYTGEMVDGQLLRDESNFNIFTYFDNADNYEYVPIIEGTQGQYTGLEDGEGWDIYEGDLLQGDDGEIYEVHDFCGCFGIRDKELRFNPLHDVNEDKIIVGNIHQNKDLMGGGLDD